ncbi:hypothetical protein BDU57DRAFT_509508 [Ampelomyces quisqualis]|uniref:Uncharacterized protein n=1 Tax=Ampelomyces quisqualis TaxID=50730 RepID=A0A6A5R4W4_AMPQU|nr:hypothetical protein BDU57DRAFT_509508 [Ampelomyces quisqualis]
MQYGVVHVAAQTTSRFALKSWNADELLVNNPQTTCFLISACRLQSKILHLSPQSWQQHTFRERPLSSSEKLSIFSHNGCIVTLLITLLQPIPLIAIIIIITTNHALNPAHPRPNHRHVQRPNARSHAHSPRGQRGAQTTTHVVKLQVQAVLQKRRGA